MSTCVEVAEQFGTLIAKTDYTSAHKLLTKKEQVTYSPNDFKKAVEEMTAYAPGPIEEVVVMKDHILDDWPDKEASDVASMYVSLSGDGFCEAVSIILANECDDIRIRELEWGRP